MDLLLDLIATLSHGARTIISQRPAAVFFALSSSKQTWASCCAQTKSSTAAHNSPGLT